MGDGFGPGDLCSRAATVRKAGTRALLGAVISSPRGQMPQLLSVKRQAWSSLGGRYPHDDSDRFRGVRKKRTRPIHLYYICSDGLMRSQRNS